MVCRRIPVGPAALEATIAAALEATIAVALEATIAAALEATIAVGVARSAWGSNSARRTC